MRRRIRLLVVRVARLLAERLGYDMVWRDYYSPVPELDAIPEGEWQRRSGLAGLEDWDVDRHLEYLGSTLEAFITEFRSPRGFRIDNGSYGPVDAEVLYAMVRAHKPRRVVEVGAGLSTLVTAAACERNRHDGHRATFMAVDPHPPDYLPPKVAGLAEVRAQSVTEVPRETFTELRAGDILFLDTTHTVKLGGEVTYLVLDVLPVLAPGVIVHFHDIFLPWHYPRRWFEDHAYYWAEQYLLQAFLSFNTEFEVLIACHQLSRDRPVELSHLVPSFRDGVSPAALWLRRREVLGRE